MASLGDRIIRVRKILGNRTDIDSRIADWLKESYLEIAMGYPFEELEDELNTTLVDGTAVYSYPVTDLTNGSTLSGYEVRAVKSLVIILSTGERRQLRKRAIKILDRVSAVNEGIPAFYATFKRMVTLRPVPDAAYTLFWRVWCKPQFTDPITDTGILLPDDWLEIVDYGAAMRGHSDLGEPEKSAAVFQLLHGAEDPRTGRRTPGMIRQRMLVRQAESEDEDYAYQPMKRAYTG